MKDFFVHESSFVDDGAHIGAGTKIWHFCHIQGGAVIGTDCSLGQNVNIANNVHIGNGCRIQNNVSVYEGVTLEDNVFCGPSCVFTNVNTPRAHFPVHGVYEKTRICEGASLGANCTVVCGHTVGRSALIAAGAVGMAENFDSGSAQVSLLVNLSGAASAGSANAGRSSPGVSSALAAAGTTKITECWLRNSLQQL